MRPETHRPDVAALAGLLLAAAATLLLAGCGGASDAHAAPRNVLILGFDGLDYDLTRKLMDEGRLPNFSRLAAETGLQQARYLGAAAEPGGVVGFHHRHGRRWTRHLRLRASRSEDHEALPVDQPRRLGRERR